MSLENWLSEGKIAKHKTSPREIADLFRLCDRDLETVKIKKISPDWRLSIAHNAAIQAAKAALAATGYRTRKEGQHYLLIQSLAFTLNTDPIIVKQLDKFRRKRNISDYEKAGFVTEQEAEEMILLAQRLRNDVEQWLRTHHPELITEI